MNHRSCIPRKPGPAEAIKRRTEKRRGTERLRIWTAVAFVFGIVITAHAVAADKATFVLRSDAFAGNRAIPVKFTCQGEDLSPPLTWSGVPERARSLVLIVDDPDAPDPKAPKITWVHWVLYNIPPEATGLPEGVLTQALPPGTREGINSWKKTGYGGPCPPIGRHRYFHKLYALDTVLEGLHRPDKAQIEQAMQGHIVATTRLIGTYQKSR